MTTKSIKDKLTNHIGDTIKIKYNLGRNKYESYDVKLKELYNKVFIVEGENKVIKSFTYSDIITKIIKIDFNDWFYKNNVIQLNCNNTGRSVDEWKLHQ